MTDLHEAYEGRTEEGEPLSMGARAFSAVIGTVNIVSTAAGLAPAATTAVKGATNGVKGAFKAAKTAWKSRLKETVDDVPAISKLDDAVDDLPKPTGHILSDEVLVRLKEGMLRDGVELKRNADEFLRENGARALLRVWKDGSATLYLASNATRYQLLHELQHLEHLREIGPTEYRKLARTVEGLLEQEQFVYDKLRKFHWDGLTESEQLDARRYISLLGGNAW